MPNEIGEAPLNIVFEAPEGALQRSVEEMIVGTERGILVTRLWYIREVDPYEKILTGMTRDGTFPGGEWKDSGRSSKLPLQREPHPYA